MTGNPLVCTSRQLNAQTCSCTSGDLVVTSSHVYCTSPIATTTPATTTSEGPVQPCDAHTDSCVDVINVSAYQKLKSTSRALNLSDAGICWLEREALAPYEELRTLYVGVNLVEGSG